MYAYISLNLYQQKQISWFVEPPYSELLQKLSGGIRGSPPERVVYTRNLLRVYIAVVPVLQKSSPGQTHKMTHTITPPSHTLTHRKTHKTGGYTPETPKFPIQRIC